MSGFRTPLKRARGPGAAGHGVGHWMSERLTSIVLVPLSLWGALAALELARSDYAGAVIWLQSPVNAVMSVLLVAVSFLHMHAGMRVIIEDYIARPITKIGLMVLNLFTCGLVGAIAVFCLLRVALGA